ncbi:c-type cytochrome [Pseudoduganella sp. GCM10020061]|uniref:c-type cytochrome n=1 Tax=Pseudoduganella sp. GCM10020061 TaxID=3317345 RepID=UPI00362A6020
MITRAALAAATLLCMAGAGASSPQAPAAQPGAQTGALLPRDSRDAAVFRGGLVYSSYCVTCHGINADGNGRAARLYTPRPANLRTTDKNDAYVELIVRKGGEAIGRSAKMPPWEEELTNEQVRDVVAFIRSINAQ